MEQTVKYELGQPLSKTSSYSLVIKQKGPSWSFVNLNDYFGNERGTLAANSKGLFNSAKKVKLENKTILWVELQNRDSEMVPHRIDLNNQFGNVDGKLDWKSRGFMASATETCLNGSTFGAKLGNSQGNESTFAIDLDKHIGNTDGKLVWSGADVSKKARSMWLVSSILAAQIGGAPTQIDLDNIFDNNEGKLMSGSKFSQTARATFLDGSMLTVLLMDPNSVMRSSTVDLNAYIGKDAGEKLIPGKDFFKDAKDVQLLGAVLYAELPNSHGDYGVTSLPLSEKMKQKDQSNDWVISDKPANY